MTNSQKDQFTRYEMARIIGARALQIAMDAPLLIKIPEEELKEIGYDAMKIAEKEFDSGALPINIHRPVPRRRRDKLSTIREEAVSDEEIVEKEQEVEKEIVESAEKLGFVNPGDADEEMLGRETSEEE